MSKLIPPILWKPKHCAHMSDDEYRAYLDGQEPDPETMVRQ